MQCKNEISVLADKVTAMDRAHKLAKTNSSKFLSAPPLQLGVLGERRGALRVRRPRRRREHPHPHRTHALREQDQVLTERCIWTVAWFLVLLRHTGTG